MQHQASSCEVSNNHQFHIPRSVEVQYSSTLICNSRRYDGILKTGQGRASCRTATGVDDCTYFLRLCFQHALWGTSIITIQPAVSWLRYDTICYSLCFLAVPCILRHPVVAGKRPRVPSCAIIGWPTVCAWPRISFRRIVRIFGMSGLRRNCNCRGVLPCFGALSRLLHPCSGAFSLRAGMV